MWANVLPSGEKQVDLSPLLEIVPNLSRSDLRVCGSVSACQQLIQGLKEQDICPASIRTESW